MLTAVEALVQVGHAALEMSPPSASRMNHRGDRRALSPGKRIYNALRTRSEGRRTQRADVGASNPEACQTAET